MRLNVFLLIRNFKACLLIGNAREVNFITSRRT